MKKITKSQIFFCNIGSVIYNIFKPRDKDVWLFGSWFGDRFSDNSRFLFQYLSDNKEKYGIKRVVWVTRNEELFNEMTLMGYEVYLMDSRESKRVHLTAGVHVICNSVDYGVHAGDILGRYSFKAKKVQLWHGVGIKAAFRWRNDEKKASFRQKLKYYLQDSRFCRKFFMYPGDWGNAFYLATSKEVARVRKIGLGLKDSQIITAVYPRFCDTPRLLSKEEEFISHVKDLKKNGKKIILHLPTYRDFEIDEEKNTYLAFSAKLLEWLKKNNVVLIDKPHAAANMLLEDMETSDELIILDKEFDVNVLYSEIDALITDYSSASSDCIYRRLPVIYYIPDYDSFENGNRGFVNDFELYCPGPVSKDIDELIINLDKVYNGSFFDKDMSERYDRTIDLLFENRKPNMEDVVVSIVKADCSA